jgi:hypothetical protein
MPDYTKLSGAEFQRAVGVDPEKWAEAFVQSWAFGVHPGVKDRAEKVAQTADWFRDAMAAAVRDAVAPRWDQQYSDEDLEAAAKQAKPSLSD